MDSDAASMKRSCAHGLREANAIIEFEVHDSRPGGLEGAVPCSMIRT
jgi:hypothetical protein